MEGLKEIGEIDAANHTVTLLLGADQEILTAAAK
jgi:hypothetical protein